MKKTNKVMQTWMENKVFYNVWLTKEQDMKIRALTLKTQLEFPEANKSQVIRMVVEAGLKALKLGVLILLFVAPTRAYAEPPIDFSRTENQLSLVASYAIANLSYKICKDSLNMSPLAAYLVSHVGTAALSMAADQWMDNTPGVIDQQRQFSMLGGLLISTTISLNFD